MADDFNNPNNGNNNQYAQSDAQVQAAVNNAMAEQKKKKKKKKLIIFGIIAAVIVVIIIAASGGSSSDDKNKVENIDNSVSQNAKESESQTEAIPDKIEAGKSITIDKELKISYKKCNTNFKNYSKYLPPADGNKVISADFTIENISDTDQYINTINCYADNTKCEQFYAVENYKNPFIDVISSGRSVSGTVYFEVPKNAKDIELEFENNVWTEDKVIFVIK